MARGCPPEPIAAVLPSLVAASNGRGLLSSWVRQIAVLRHPATMAFMTHGGSSSAVESVICGVPMSKWCTPRMPSRADGTYSVHWPCMWDQPEIANEMDYRGVAHELIQFRGG
jgi:hypothetical protein